MVLGTIAFVTGVRFLTAEQHAEIETLAELCRKHDGLELPLYLEPDSAVPGNEKYHFLYYERGTLVGFVSVPSGNDPEVIGVVHPALRRRGIGSQLLRFARKECRTRGLDNFLLVCENSSDSGVAFADALGGEHEFTEYLMQLDAALLPSAAVVSDPVVLKWAGPEDTKVLTTLFRAAGDLPDDKADAHLQKWLQNPTNRFALGLRDGQPIGMIRIDGSGPHLYLYTFCVLPELRGRGYGRQILTGVVRDLLPENKEIRLEVETNNRNALGLYLSCGFKEITGFRYYRVGV